MCSSTAADQHFLIPGHLLPRRRDKVLEDTSFRSTDLLTCHCYQPSINPVYSREHKAPPDCPENKIRMKYFLCVNN